MRLHRLTLPALACLTMAVPVLAAEPKPLVLGRVPVIRNEASVSENQKMANAVAEQLRASGHLRGYRIDVSVANGMAELSGFVADAHQRDEAVRLAHSVPGVEQVRSLIKVNQATGRIRQAADEPVAKPPTKMERIGGPHEVQDPLPSFRAPVPQEMAETIPPPLPTYAWPTYAPHNNFSRVAHPTCYPYEEFPFIGPVYPFPKVPLGWRSVKLQFDDGHWWLSSHAQHRDWWFIRYW